MLRIEFEITFTEDTAQYFNHQRNKNSPKILLGVHNYTLNYDIFFY